MLEEPQESLIETTVNDPLIRQLNKAVVIGVKFLAILMVLVVFLSIADVVVHLYMHFKEGVPALFTVENLFTILGAFLAVLVAIEIFLNIIFYLKRDAIHVPLVLATALTAIARKVIIVDFTTISADIILAVAATIFALGLSYWLITKRTTSQKV